MLKINEEQKKVFESISLLSFEDEMVLHSKIFSSKLCGTMGDEELHLVIRHLIKRAGFYGFTNRGSIRLFIELILLYGDGFDTDPQYPEISKILKSSDSQMLRAKHIYEWVMEYYKRVAGSENINTQKALDSLASYILLPITNNLDNFNDEMIQLLKSIFPQKVEYIGIDKLNRLINEASEKGKKYGLFLSSGIDILVVLKFLFGHSCEKDPLYSWILSTLQNKKFTSPEVRTNELRLEALKWLDQEFKANRTKY